MHQPKSRMEKILENLPEVQYVVDREGILRYVKFAKTSGGWFDPVKSIGKPVLSVLHPDVAPLIDQKVREVFQSVMAQVCEFTLAIPENPSVPMHFTAYLNAMDEREVLVSVRDVSKRVHAEKKLMDSENRYRRLFELSPLPKAVLDAESLRFLDVNDAAVRQYGYSREEFLGLSPREIFSDEELQKEEDIKPGRPCENLLGQWRHRKKDGSLIQVEVFCHQIFFEGRDARIIICHDVTEKEMARRALEESEEKFRRVFLASPDAFTVTRAEDGRIVDVNDSFSKISGWSREEVIGKTSLEIGLFDEPEGRNALMKALEKEGVAQNLEIQYRHKNGEIIYGLTSGTLVAFDGVPHLLAVTRDITAIRKAQAAIREGEERFEAIFNTSPDAIVILDMETRKIADVNEGFVTLSGYRKDDVIGKTTEAVGLWDVAAQKDEFYRILDQTGFIDSLECRFILKDGSLEKGLLSARPLQLKGRPYLLVTVRDVSSLLETQKKLRASVAEKEVLLREVHHRVKNNLQVILGLLNLQEHHIADEQGRQIFKESQNRILTMSLIHEVLYQSRDLARINFRDYLVSLT
ncbi:MAG: PAS domain S-box protein, partial [Proteobacteria bacterium]|nr:PAS domain S-box protein [Pseudomonadota bacterium]